MTQRLGGNTLSSLYCSNFLAQLSMHCPLFLAAVLIFSICPIVSGEPVLSLGQLTLQNSDDKPQTWSTIALTKCQSDYLSALIHRCMIRGAPTMPEGRICFTDEVQLEDAYKLVGYISEMCCLLRCQAKTLERLCCRHAQQGRCRKANCLPIRDQKVLWRLAAPLEHGADDEH